MNTISYSPPAGVSSDAQSIGGPLISAAGGPVLGKNAKNLLGQKFNRLTVIAFAGRTLRSNILWRCRCDCGGSAVATTSALLGGKTQSCGCFQKDRTAEASRIDIAGCRFGRYTALYRARTNSNGSGWMCRCDCGTERVVSTGNLRNGNSKSCGCLNREKLLKANFNPSLTDEDRRKWRTEGPGKESFRRLRQQIYARDDYTCLACGIRGARLTAHHIFPWALYPKGRYLASNIVTLCKQCHDEFHLIYRHDCDLDDLIEYLKEEHNHEWRK